MNPRVRVCLVSSLFLVVVAITSVSHALDCTTGWSTEWTAGSEDYCWQSGAQDCSNTCGGPSRFGWIDCNTCYCNCCMDLVDN
jgi:hypothetical protein